MVLILFDSWESFPYELTMLGIHEAFDAILNKIPPPANFQRAPSTRMPPHSLSSSTEHMKKTSKLFPSHQLNLQLKPPFPSFSSSTPPFTSTASSSSSKAAAPTTSSDLSHHFKRLLNPNSVPSWNSIISDLARDGEPLESLRAFRSMLVARLRPDRSSFPCAIKSCAALRDPRSGRQLHLQALASGLQPDLFVSSSLVDMYCKCGELPDARKVFDETPEKNAVNFTSMIVGHVLNGAPGAALAVFKEFLSDGGGDPVDHVMAVAAISACSRDSGAAVTRGVHGFVEKVGLGVDVSVRNTLIDAYAKSGDAGMAREVFDGMEVKDVVSWNTILAVYARNGLSMGALKLYVEMAGDGSLVRDAVTLSTVMLACARAGVLQFGKRIHNQVIRLGLEQHVHVGTSVIDMYAKCGKVGMARKVFDRMIYKNVQTWTAMVAGYGMHGDSQQALEIFSQMRRHGVKPNHVTFVAVLAACSHAGLLDEGRNWFKVMQTEFNMEPGLEHYGCMVDLLGRAGHLSEAYDMIKQMKVGPDSVGWASLLSACRVHKNVELGEISARKLFELDPKNCGYYVTLSSIYADAGRWHDAERMRAAAKRKGLVKPPGYSLAELKGRMHVFLIGDRRHPQHEEIYRYLKDLNAKMLLVGYIPDTTSVLHDIDQEEKETVLRIHSEKLAVAFLIINTEPGATIHVIKNLRICSDCHSAMIFISKIVQREIVIRDSHRFHHFKAGLCTCGDYW